MRTKKKRKRAGKGIRPTDRVIENSKEFKERLFYRTINGEVMYRTPYGFCHLNAHKGYLSARQAKKHECLKKECPFLRMNLAHDLNRKYSKELEAV